MKKKSYLICSLFKGHLFKLIKNLGIVAIFLILPCLTAAARTYSESIKISLKIADASLEDVFKVIQKQSEFDFYYRNDELPGKKVSLDLKEVNVERVLEDVLEGTDLSYMVFDKKIVITHEGDAGSQQQERSISGTVSDQNGQPMPGVSVSVKGSVKGTITDVNGHYNLKLSQEEQVLFFSFIGMKSQEIVLGESNIMDVVLLEDVVGLDEVVAIGYGMVKKSDLTGSVKGVKADELLDRPVISVSEALQGRVSGVEVNLNSGRPGSDPKVRIRGSNSINSSNDPLYVVDGVIGVQGIGYLNPNDIESVEVLKDASATAIYGARGANGVILITTKRGKSGIAEVSYDGYIGISELAKKVDYLNSEEFLLIDKMAYENSEKFDPVGWANGKYVYRDPTDPSLSKLFNADGTPKYDTDWQKEATRTALTHNHQLSIRGGNEKSTYGLFLGYLDQEGIMKTSYMKRYSGKFTLDTKVKDWLSFGGNLSLNQSKENRIDGGTGGLTALRMMAEALPFIPVKYPDGTWGSNADFPGTEGGENPVNVLYNREDLYTRTKVLGNTFALIRFSSELELKTSIGLDINNIKNSFYSGRELNALSADQKGVAEIRNYNRIYWQNENYLTWNKELNEDNRINAMAGFSWQEYSSEYSYCGAEDFTDDFYGWHNLGLGSTRRQPDSEDYKWSLNSYFARLNYNLKEKYLFTLTGRYDGSSRFGENNKYAFFPSGAIGWRVSEEDFMKSFDFISNLKVRTSYGLTGNTEIGQFQSIARIGSNTAIFDGKSHSGTPQGTLGNPDLKWEKTSQFDIGVDLGLFNGRIDLALDYYYKETKDLLLDAPVPYTSGFSSVYMNIGSVENKGFEASLNTVNIDSDFKWYTTINFSINRNKVLSLGENDDDIFPGPWFLGQTNILRVGEAVGSFWGPIRLGTWNEDEAQEAAKYGKKPGDLKYKDLDENHVINGDDETIIGSIEPDWTGNIINTLRYKNVEFSFDIQFVMGNEVFNMTKHSIEDRQGLANSLATVLDAWSPDHQDAIVAQVRNSKAGYDTHSDTHWLEDGSFIRGRNFKLSYDVPKTRIADWGLRKLKFYVSAQNLFTISDYSGYDPEFSTYGNAFAQGIEFFQYPKARTYTFGLNVTF